jgi:hypothetical protein
MTGASWAVITAAVRGRRCRGHPCSGHFVSFVSASVALLGRPFPGRALGALDDGRRFEPVPGSRWAVVEGIERP